MARSAIFNPYRISAQERTFLANTVMKLASIIITHLEQNQNAKETYFPDGEYNDVDFTKMSREEILNTVNINSIFNIIREQYFNTSWIEGNPEILDKLDLIYDNWGALMEMGNNAFIMLEGRAISKIVEKDSIKMDTGNDKFR